MQHIYIDAGISTIKIKSKQVFFEFVNDDNIDVLISKNKIDQLVQNSEVLISGKLAAVFKRKLGKGTLIESSAAMWARAIESNPSTQAIIDLSASGFTIICTDRDGNLVNDLMISHPKCGAGSGINLMRILQKLDIKKEKVDQLLHQYLGQKGKNSRKKIPIRADRCGVFSSSATISDKNQGIPLEHALAVTIKSEVLKACKKLNFKIESVILTGGVFLWEYAKDCARDYLEEQGAGQVFYEKYCLINGLQTIQKNLKSSLKNISPDRLIKKRGLVEYPNFKDLKLKYETNKTFKRYSDSVLNTPVDFSNIPINISFDVGSTMAKVVIEDANTKELIYLNSHENNGDTIETIKGIFKKTNANQLNIQQIGITGSGRYQVKTILEENYPQLRGNIYVLVENYAHARGSIEFVNYYIKELPSKVNKEFCILVDIGGEDTKLSIVSLKKEELFDNVMNIKCSAGTGSLMDTLKAMFGIAKISQATQMAFNSKKAYGINATCAVFLMENAKKMQIEGYGKDEILASCNYAIVENMARSLWNQVDLPKNAVVLLHGQTMLSDPLPLAVTYRIQEDGEHYCVIPPFPGHRACIGLLKSLGKKPIKDNYCDLNLFVNQAFTKKMVVCHGVACGDKNARCTRTLLGSCGGDSKILLGGCSAVNELLSDRKKSKNGHTSIDAYKDIWNFVNSNLPFSEDPNRLIIPRIFAVSEYAFLISKIFENLNIPVHVDTIQGKDILKAQSDFPVDVCAPFIGVKGQLDRLSKEPHGMILLPQIDFLPSNEQSLGRTCTINQGGVVIARNLSGMVNSEVRFLEFDLSLKSLDLADLVEQFLGKIQPIADHYKISVDKEILGHAISRALEEEEINRVEISNKASDYIAQAIELKRNISLVCAREYVLNPGVYDSHIGRLLKDKQVIAIPSYALRTKLDSDFNHIYWKNPHDILSKVKAVTNGTLHEILLDERPAQLIKKIETNSSDTIISTTQVSTFRCGPDSVTLPTSAEITRNKPSLLVQSDGMIKELAHLENRVNTHVNQLNKRLYEDVDFAKVDFKIINGIGINKVNKNTDVVYLPTMHDNRAINAILRSSGITVIDNYEDESYDLEKISKLGRKYAGDSICLPMASVFGDILLARVDFLKRKNSDDPLVNGKTRVVIFDNKGTGPCRQGQYYEQHKLLATKYFSDDFTKLVVGHESENYDIGLEEWALIQVFHGLIIKGVLNTLYLNAGSSVKNTKEFETFDAAFRIMKDKVYHVLENGIKPKEFFVNLIKNKKDNLISVVAKYFIYGLHNNNGIPQILKDFSNHWVKPFDSKISIYVEGEVYVREAQTIDIFKSVIDTIGFRSAKINYTPLWTYMEVIMEEKLGLLNEELAKLKNKGNTASKEIKAKQKEISNTNLTITIFRNRIAKPIYAAAKVEMPKKMDEILKEASRIFPTMKPLGELLPFTGEALHKLREDNVDLVFNVNPEGCMVASMGQVITPKILQISQKGRIESLSTLNGELDEDKIKISILKCLGPFELYRS